MRITLSSFNDAEHVDHIQHTLLVVGRNVIRGTIKTGTGSPDATLSSPGAIVPR